MASTINASTSSGLVSTADTSGVLQLQTAGTTAVSIDASQAVTFSAGTANGVSYLNGSKVLTTGSALVFDGTNLGIGTSSPSVRLESRKDTNATINELLRLRNDGVGDNTGTKIGFSSGADEKAAISSFFVSGWQLAFNNNGSERMRLDASGNLGIGTTPNASAILDAQSTTKGVRMPNMTTTQKNAIASPAAGLMVFDTTLAKLCVYSGSAWQTITSV